MGKPNKYRLDLTLLTIGLIIVSFIKDVSLSVHQDIWKDIYYILNKKWKT